MFFSWILVKFLSLLSRQSESCWKSFQMKVRNLFVETDLEGGWNIGNNIMSLFFRISSSILFWSNWTLEDQAKNQ